MRRRAAIRIGVSGWTYPPWRGAFYPKGLPQRMELSFLARGMPAVEINGTFYGMQRPAAFAAWAAATPDDFVFAVKGPRFLTHMLKLTRIEAPLGNFFASGLFALGRKLGPILWQFPERFAFSAERFEPFLAMLPKTPRAASALAQKHDHRLRAPALADAAGIPPLRHAVEIRHRSFCHPDFVALLRRYGVALVTADTVAWPLLMDLTADFVYCRLHGSRVLYQSRYEDDELDRWAARLTAWAEGRPMRDGNFVSAPVEDNRPRDVFLFFDNTDKRHAPEDARRLMARLGLDWEAAHE